MNLDDTIIFGDWHGNHPFTEAAIKYAAETRPDVDLYLHAGDLGYWPRFNNFHQKLSKILNKFGKTLIFIDGNHEDFWNLLHTPTVEMFGQPFHKLAPHVYHAPRGTMLPNGTLLFGVAPSIDLYLRQPGVNWYAEETPTPDDLKKALQTVGEKNVKLLVTHDTAEVPPDCIIGATNFPPEVAKYLAETRELLADLFENISPKQSVHGHYHVPYVGHNPWCTKIIGLDKDCDNPNVTQLQNNQISWNINNGLDQHWMPQK